jgi:hypothetical protein
MQTRSGRSGASGVMLVLVLVAGCGANDTPDEAASPRPSPGSPAPASSPSLLVSGRITPERVVLEPALRLDAPASVPGEAGGAHRLRGTDAGGAALFEFRFDAAPVADAPGREEHFAFAVPLAEAALAALAVIEVRLADGRRAERRATLGAAELRAVLAAPGAVTAMRGAAGEVRLRWDGGRFPLVAVRDPATRAILTFGRGGEATVRTELGALEVVVSDGVRSGGKVVAVE